MIRKRVTPTERVYHKVVEPGLGSFQAIPRTSHSCVRYQPALMVPKAPSLALSSVRSVTTSGSGGGGGGGGGGSRSRAATEPLETTLPQIQGASRMTRSAADLGGNHLIPVYQPGRDDAINLQRAASPNSFNSTTRMKQLPLPQVKSHELVRSTSPRGMKNVSISGDRYLGTAKSQPSRTGPAPRPQPHYVSPSVARKEQVRRFEEEQANLFVTRTMKRKSEIMSHRVDRMYYLCGSGLSAQGRYEVDEAELERLREFSRTRNNSRANSGRSSAVSRRSLTESSILSEGRIPSQGKRSPLGSPLGSPRCTPISKDESVELSVQGSGVKQNGDEVKGQTEVKDGGQAGGGGEEGGGGGCGTESLGEGAGSAAGDGTKDANEVDGSEGTKVNNGSDGHVPNDSKNSDNQKTSPHRTEGQADERETEQGNDGQNGSTSSNGVRTGGGGDGSDSRRGTEKSDVCDRTEGGDGDGGEEKDGKTMAGGGGDGRGERDGETTEGGGVDGENTDTGGAREGQNEKGKGDNSDIDGAEKGGHDGGNDEEDSTKNQVTGEGGEEGEEDLDEDEATDTQEDAEGNGGDATEGRSGETEGSRDPTNLVESIAPGLNLNKTPVYMKKSDVYLMEFDNPRRAHLRGNLDDDHDDNDDSNTSPGQSGRDGHGHQFQSQESEISRREERLQRVSALTQGVDDVGRMTESGSHDLPGLEAGKSDYDGGVFAQARGEEEREAAQKRKIERREAKVAACLEREEAKEVREKAERASAKRANTVKFKMDEIYNFISSRQRDIFEQKFKELDTDGNGQITLKELTKKMHKTAPKEDIRQLHQVFDLNKDKTVDQREFVTVAALNDKLIGQEIASEAAPLELNLNRLSLHITAYKEMFEVVDQNQDGRLSMEEIMLIVTLSSGLDVGTDKDVVRQIHSTIDKDENGTIDFIEFISYIPFFQKIHQHIIGTPVSIEEIEEARLAVRKAMKR